MQPRNAGTRLSMGNDRDFAEKRFTRPGDYRTAVVYTLVVIALAGVAFAFYATGPRDSVFRAALVPAFLFAGGVGALIRAYREWKIERGWTAWQGAGWLLLLSMLVTLSVPGSAAFAS